MTDYKKGNIYVICPPAKATGGPEALHQLGALFIELGYNAKMLYTRRKLKPVHDYYKNYKVPYVFSVKDKRDNILIVPESLTNLINKYPLSQKKVWWLSFDFYFVLMEDRKQKKLKHKLFPSKYKEYYFEENPTVEHWYQSQRTNEFLETKPLKTPKYYLCDYVNDIFFENLNDSIPKNKENIITYNPKKGLDKIEQIKALLPQYNWLPLQGMNRVEMRDVLRKTKLHVDFGYFPGRDKIPREALVSYCCLLTGREGTAAFKEDLGIPEEYKLEFEKTDIKEITAKIENIMENYDSVLHDFSNFRSFVVSEKDRMRKDLLTIINK